MREKELEEKLKWGVTEADIDSSVNAETMSAAGIPSIQLHTGGMCHLDADMTKQGLWEFGRLDLDLAMYSLQWKKNQGLPLRSFELMEALQKTAI